MAKDRVLRSSRGAFKAGGTFSVHSDDDGIGACSGLYLK